MSKFDKVLFNKAERIVHSHLCLSDSSQVKKRVKKKVSKSFLAPAFEDYIVLITICSIEEENAQNEEIKNEENS